MSTAKAIRMISELSKKEILDVDRRNISIRDLQALQTISLRG